MIVKVSHRGVTRFIEMAEPPKPSEAKPQEIPDAQIVHDYLSGVPRRTIALAYGWRINDVRDVLAKGTTADERRLIEAAHHAQRQREWLTKQGVNPTPGPRYRSVRT